MLKRKGSRLTKYRVSSALKLAAVVAALGFAVLALEQPHLGATTSVARGNDSSLYMTDAGGSPVLSRPSEPAATSDTKLSPTTSEYFPSRFAPPSGEIEPLPPTF
jgi:hypothetical protein